MKSKLMIRLAAAIAFASLALGAQSALRSGISVTKQQEYSIRVGMTAEEVLAILGPPASRFSYRAEPGPSWSYTVTGLLPDNYSFEVQFGADGKVAYAHERYTPAGG
jgi:hypothetical protein